MQQQDVRQDSNGGLRTLWCVPECLGDGWSCESQEGRISKLLNRLEEGNRADREDGEYSRCSCKLSSVVDGQAGSTIVQASQDGESLANAGDPVRSPPAQRDGNGAVRQ